MAEDPVPNISEGAIRLRSYLIWEREGRPDGLALNHWLRAKAELAAELRAPSPRHRPGPVVLPRVPISTPPCKSVSAKIDLAESRAPLNVAKK